MKKEPILRTETDRNNEDEDKTVKQREHNGKDSYGIEETAKTMMTTKKNEDTTITESTMKTEITKEKEAIQQIVKDKAKEAAR
jgi:hypothetical protein